MVGSGSPRDIGPIRIVRTVGLYLPDPERERMPQPKSAFDRLLPCDFYEPAEIMDPELMYTVTEIAKLLQGLDPSEEIDPETEAVLLDWAIPWVMTHSDDLVVAEPADEDQPGYYGVGPAET